jgi:uncharacterized repeat protein (TIGR01451 family)
MVVPSSPATVSFVGNHANPPAFYGYDTDYLYFRYRMDGNPSSGVGFAQALWTAFMQVPSKNPDDRFEYQYQLLLNGKSDTIEIWQNTDPQPIQFDQSGQFHVDTQVRAYYDAAGSLARVVAAGTSFNGGPDWFLDFAFPVKTLAKYGVISTADDLAQAVFFPRTSTDPNNYSKSYLKCPFGPGATLAIAKTVTPTVAVANQTTQITYTIEVENTGATTADGVVVQEIPLPAFLTIVGQPKAVSDDPAAVVSTDPTNPLVVKCSTLSPGRRLTVVITANATPGYGTADFVNTASVWATNAAQQQASATLGYDACDGVDNDHDGKIDDGTSLCDDGNACTTDTCEGKSGCSHVAIAGCMPCTFATDCPGASDGCSTAVCSAGVCAYEPTPGCTSCTTAADCDQGDPCTTDTCAGGVCGAVPGTCAACKTAADCDDSNPCTTDVCGVSGSCELTAIPGCRVCNTAADCDDGNACTTDTCVARTCQSQPIDGCTTGGGGGTGTGTGGGGGTGTGGGGTGTGTGGAGGTGTGGNGGTGTGSAPGNGVGQVPGHTGEICGDCIDNDGDGLVDYEDPDCCEQIDPLTLKRMVMRMRPQTAGDTLRLQSRGVAAGFTPVDLANSGITLQLSDNEGQLYCHDLGLVATKGAAKRGVFRFRDKSGSVADGLQRARLKFRKDGQVVFRAAGGKMQLRSAGDGGVTVTLRVGGMCMQTTAALRARPAKLGTRSVFP